LLIESSPVQSKQELKLDKNIFNDFIIKDVMKFWDKRDKCNIDDGIIDLFSLFDKKISQYIEKWDRSALVMVIIYNKYLCFMFIVLYFVEIIILFNFISK